MPDNRHPDAASGDAIDDSQRQPKQKPESKPAPVEKLEAVNHPAYYGGDTLHEVKKCLLAWGLKDNAYLWTVAKYIARAGKKLPRYLNGPKAILEAKLEDLKKARFYLNEEIADLEKELNP